MPQRAEYQQSDHQIIAVLLDVGSRSDLELSLALDGVLRPETCWHIGRTKLLKQHLHQRLAFVIYGASYEAYYTLGVCWCLWNSMRAPCNQVSVFWRTVLNDRRHTMPSSLNRWIHAYVTKRCPEQLSPNLEWWCPPHSAAPRLDASFPDSGAQAPLRLLLGLQCQYPLRTPGYIASGCLFDLACKLRRWSQRGLSRWIVTTN